MRAGRKSASQHTDAHLDVGTKEVHMTKSPVARLRDERGVTTAEYAVVTAAGCGFASVLIKLLTSDWGQTMLKRLFELVMQVVGL
jgi:Flp pilus assembly pilin Flp